MEWVSGERVVHVTLAFDKLNPKLVQKTYGYGASECRLYPYGFPDRSTYRERVIHTKKGDFCAHTDTSAANMQVGGRFTLRSTRVRVQVQDLSSDSRRVNSEELAAIRDVMVLAVRTEMAGG